ncbi:MAG: hypothetical protein H6625_03140 [Bdellovibrionaceae bacterium]|nr:hypothetical protein [Pseudobdellovibrionaceae bacterium]
MFIIFSCFESAFSAQVKMDENFKQKVIKTQQAIWLCHILREKKQESRISNMEFKLTKIPVFMVPKEDAIRPLVKLQIKFEKPGWELFVDDKIPVKKTDDPNIFLVYAYLNSRISEVTFKAKNKDDGSVESEIVYLFAPEAREYKMVSPLESVIFTLGLGNLIYEQTSFGVFNGNSLLLGVEYLTPEKGSHWGLLSRFHITFLTFESEPLDHNPQFYEGDLLATYNSKVIPSPRWRSRWLGGLSTVGLISQGSPFGFSNLYGPSFGFRTEYYKNRDESYSIQFNYVTYDKISLDQDRALKVKLSWHNNLSNLRQMQTQILYSNNTFTSGFEEVIAELWGLSLGLSF